MQENSWFSQDGYQCRFDWGRRGAREAARRGDILVIVDTLSFSTAAVTAVHHGGIVYPCSRSDDQEALARRVCGEAAVGRDDVPSRGRFSLSPLTYQGIAPCTRIVLGSPNGATCSRYGREARRLFVGALVNARAVAMRLRVALEFDGGALTVIACGERWGELHEDGELRVAIEDYLGAGAIFSALALEKSPEAAVCEGAFLHCRDRLEELVWECGSGRELREKGYGNDVRHASRLDVDDTVPVLRDDRLERAD